MPDVSLLPATVLPYLCGLGVDDPVLRKLHRTQVIFQYRYTRHADIGQYAMPMLRPKKNVINDACERNKLLSHRRGTDGCRCPGKPRRTRTSRDN